VPLTSILLVLLAAVTHASWNYFAKRSALIGAPFLFWSSAISMVLYAPWAAWVALNGHMAWTLPVIACLVVGATIHLAYSFALQHGYKVADLSVVYPIARGTGPLLASLGAFVLLAEVPGVLRALGLMGVIAGILLIATDGRFETFARPGALAGLRWGAITGALIACYTLVDGYGVKVLLIAPVVLDWTSNALRTAMLTPSVLHRRARGWEAMRGHWRGALAVGVLSPLGYILVLGALQLGAPVSVVAPMRELSMMLVALIGMVLLREPVGRARVLGCLAMVAGVILLGLS
jgi:drug/metabolite transporter (DMT)-like permease